MGFQYRCSSCGHLVSVSTANPTNSYNDQQLGPSDDDDGRYGGDKTSEEQCSVLPINQDSATADIPQSVSRGSQLKLTSNSNGLINYNKDGSQSTDQSTEPEQLLLLPTATSIVGSISVLTQLATPEMAEEADLEDTAKNDNEGEKNEGEGENENLVELDVARECDSDEQKEETDSEVMLLCLECLTTLESQTKELYKTIQKEISSYENVLSQLPEVHPATPTANATKSDTLNESSTESLRPERLNPNTSQPSDVGEVAGGSAFKIKPIKTVDVEDRRDLRIPSDPQRREEAERLETEVEDLRMESNKLESELYKIQQKIKKLDCQFVQCQVKLRHQQQQVVALEAQVHYDGRLASNFAQISVIKDAFQIGSTGKCYGTINGLRLGKALNDNVSWDEINAAWGQTGLLLDSLIQFTLEVYDRQLAWEKAAAAARVEREQTIGTTEEEDGKELGLHEQPSDATSQVSTADTQHRNSSSPTKRGASQPDKGGKSVAASGRPSIGDPRLSGSRLQNLQNYRILPRGNYSVILRRSDNALFELYGNYGGFSRFFAGRRFNQAMVLFLNLTIDLIELAALLGASVFQIKIWEIEIPNKITSTSVGGFPVHLPNANGDENWCLCLKALLFDIKWIADIVEQLSSAIDSHGPIPVASVASGSALLLPRPTSRPNVRTATAKTTTTSK